MSIKNFLNLLILLFFLVLTQLFLANPVQAQTTKQIVIVNPIRGKDFWSQKEDILENVKKQYAVISENDLPATWLVRYDALLDQNVVDFLKSLNSQQEIGIFFEITPTFAKDSGVKYNQSPNWHYSSSVFLTGYSQEDRRKYIDTALQKYKEIFGKNPTSVGAWWIDAFSLGYLKDKYNITANLDVADQYSTDQYQVWGQYWSLPFYPSKDNALLPAQSIDRKLGIVTMQWAIRDPYNAYGSGVYDSTYSVQANDYLIHQLGTNYFKKLLNIYPEITVGLENDFDWNKYGAEYINQIQLVKNMQENGLVQTKTMSQYAQYYENQYPNISPNELIQSNDPLGSEGKVVWYQTPRYRIGWFYDPNLGSRIRDLRIYNEDNYEQCFDKACQQLNLATSFINAIDDVTYGFSWIIDEGRITNVSITNNSDEVLITYTNQAGHKRSIKFMANDIGVDDSIHTLSSAILDVSQAHQEKNVTIVPVTKERTLNYVQVIPIIFINLFKFIILTILFFILPGLLLTRKSILAIPVGWALFTLIAFVTGYLHIRWAIWVLPLVSMIAVWKYSLPKIIFPQINKKNWFILFLIIIGSITWLLTVVKSGLNYAYGMGFWGPNGHDAIWHLALINQLKISVPPQNPVFSGQLLMNYHYFYDLLVAQSSNIFSIDINELVFRLFPVVISLLSGILIYKVTVKIFQNYLSGIFAVFFLYFGGSFGWIVDFIKNKTFGGESIFWSQQSISTLLNPPFAISVVLFLVGVSLFIDILAGKNKKMNYVISLILVWGTLIEFKAYIGILMLCSLGLIGLYKLIKERDPMVIIIFLGCLILSGSVFLPNNYNSSSLFVFHPLWLVDSMIDFSDRLGWPRLALAHQPYVQEQNYPKYLTVEILGILIFLIGNLGTRTIALISIPSLIKASQKDNGIRMFLFIITVGGMILSLLFIQKGTNWNVIQFFYYSLLITNIFTGGILAFIFHKYYQPKLLNKLLLGIFGFSMFCLTLPTSINTLGQYLPDQPPAMVSLAEQQALSYLKGQAPGNVLTLDVEKGLFFMYIEPRPLYAYTSTAYVSAFSGKPVFLEDETNLDILNIAYQGRINEEQDLIKLKDQVKNILHRNNIQYLYVVKIEGFEENEEEMGIKKIFENDEIKIFKVL